MNRHFCTTFCGLILVLFSVAQAEEMNPMEKLKLGLTAKAQGVPDVVFERALANHQKNKNSADCFMAADLTSEKPNAWRLCTNPIKVEKMPMQVGSGEGAGCTSHIFKNNSCIRYFGNRKNYCLPTGGNYVTQEVYGRPNQPSFLSIKGLDAGLNDSSARGTGLQQMPTEGTVEWEKKSQSVFSIPPRKNSVSLEDMSSKRTGGGMAMYVYPSREDIKAFRETGAAPYWSEDCEKKIGKPGWLGDKKASDTPSPSEVTGVAVATPAAKATAKVRAGK